MSPVLSGDARRHAVHASTLLQTAAAYERNLAEMEEEERLQMIATGGVHQANADLKWTVEVATANALAAIALAVTEREEP